MADRLRELLDRPLDARAARAMLAIAIAITVGFAALVVLYGGEQGSRPSIHQKVSAVRPPRLGSSATPAPKQRERPAQDPQDRIGSPAARRAGRQLQTHQALQHVPYREGSVTIKLVGARGGRAVLRVSASSVSAARKGWRGFLRRFDDDGRSYVPVFNGNAGTASLPTTPRAGA